MQKHFIFLVLFTAFLFYSVFVYTSGTKSTTGKMNEKAKQGQLLFQRFNCTSCHQVFGLGGYLGPELTSTLSQPGKNEMYVRSILKSGTQRMPDFQLTDEEISNLVEYLKCMNETSAMTIKR